MKKFLITVLLLALSVAFIGCAGGTEITLKISVGEGYEFYNGKYSYSMKENTLNELLESLSEDEIITYESESEYLSVNGLTYKTTDDYSVISGWVVYVDGVSASNGVYPEIKAGSNVKIIYTDFDITVDEDELISEEE